MYPANRLCHLESVAWDISEGWRKAHASNSGRRMTFLGHIGNQATTPIVREPRHGGKKGSNPFVPVTPLVLIWSKCPCLCGKLFSCNTCLFETDGWISWRLIDVFLVYACVCVCARGVFAACCSYLMVLFRFLHGGSGCSVESGANCPVGDQNPAGQL